ncbi:MAG: glycoside hydrolase family 13 protein [Blautia sp.]|nr:glycoside hydrolase family 13 protein [Lachnoclostridium sp.]MCM1210245.1 glycoside hydrolase family 13 protein [Blautia sp.]
MDNNQIWKAEQNYQYITSMRPVFNRNALFSDTTENYVSPAEPSAYGEVTIRFRSAKNNIDNVFFITKGVKHMMLKIESDKYFDYYSHTEQLENEKLSYYFEVYAGKICCYYDTRGIAKDINEHYHFQVIPGFQTPAWAKGAVFYQIYVDRFYNGDPSNDVLTNEYQYIGEGTVQVEDWDKYPAVMGVREFYGGDLQGVLNKMDYLQDLGVDVIYFNPLFVSPSNHKYDIQDYDNIDPHIGKIVNEAGDVLEPGQHENKFASKYINRVTNKENLEASNALFVEVVKEAHRRGMKVILDGVFNHCGSFNKWMDREQIYEVAPGYEKGAYISKESPYYGYFRFYEDQWPYNSVYDGWWGHDTLPKLNYENSRELFNYMLYIAQKWVSPPYNADGWRLDVAADLGHSAEYNHYFWQEFRKAVKNANPDAIILAEHYGVSKDWLQGKEWDTIMNYDAFMEPVTWFLTGMQKHSDDYREDLRGNADSFWDAMRYHCANMTNPSLQTAMNELSNHDHSRFLTRTNHKVGRINTLGAEAANEGVNKAVLREAVVIQMTWPGAPTIYYGDEAGVCGFTDPDNRRTYPWGHEDKDLIEFHKEIIQIHKRNEEFMTGSLKHMEADYNVIGYGRFTRNQQSVVLINNNDYEITKELSVWYLGTPKECILKRLILTTADSFTTEAKEYPVIAGKVQITLPPTSAIILQHINTDGVAKTGNNFLHFM